MKTKKIKFAILEESSYYNHIIQNQINGLCALKGITDLQFEITSLDNVNDLLKNTKSNYQAIVFDNHFKNNKQKAEYNVMEIIDEMRFKNKNCFFISISGYREMTVSAYLYKEGELRFTYSKQSTVKNENHEENCSIPALYKLMEKFINNIMEQNNSASQRIAA